MFDHTTVLKDEMIEKLSVKSDGTYIDCTVGGGGHSAKIAKNLSEKGTLVAIDQDKTALHAAENVLRKIKEDIIFVHDNFKNLKKIVEQNNLEKVDGIIFDLGVSSPQFDEAERGFSYRFDAPLDMRMNQNEQLTAQKIVNTWDYNKLVHIFFTYGEERFSKQVARTIERERKKAPIQTTFQLVEIIKQAIPARARRKGGHPARRIFQALRIAVNDELHVFEKTLHDAAELVSIGGRIAVITFHSLEDRICKRAFKTWSKPIDVPQNFPVIPEDHLPPFKEITRKPIEPSFEEVEKNRRARSAKLRVVEKIRQWDQKFIHKEGWKQL
ncbi:MAG TPA: 16S rRNA (cytosine(1402)-N(4))-methyltransferase RsmH [Bacillota bacterium]|nr:16S rRNA (cytosine(1402)-N(4))-methyltransferase RsmH [Bacillota bacterium]